MVRFRSGDGLNSWAVQVPSPWIARDFSGSGNKPAYAFGASAGGVSVSCLRRLPLISHDDRLGRHHRLRYFSFLPFRLQAARPFAQAFPACGACLPLPLSAAITGSFVGAARPAIRRASCGWRRLFIAVVSLVSLFFPGILAQRPLPVDL